MVCGLVNTGFSGNKDTGNRLELGVFEAFSDSLYSVCGFASNDMWGGIFLDRLETEKSIGWDKLGGL